MNKKIVLTLTCLMSVKGALAFSWMDYMPSWNTVSNKVTTSVKSTFTQSNANKSKGLFDKWVMKPLVNKVVTPLIGPVDQVGVYTSAPRAAWNFVSSNPAKATFGGYVAGSYPKLLFPACGAVAAAFTLRNHQNLHAVDEKDFSQAEKNSARKVRIAKQIVAAFSGAGTMWGLMKKPKATIIGLVALFAGFKYNEGWRPWSPNSSVENLDDQDASSSHDHSNCVDGVCPV